MKSILIVGGGVAGLTAAYHLSNEGFDVRIAEATNNLGGRLTALFDSKSGEMIDNGQHALMTAYHTFLELLNSTGNLKLLNIQKHLEVNYIDSNQFKSRLYTGKLPGKAGFLFGLISLGGISFMSKINIIKLIRAVELNKVNSEGKSVLEFLTQNNQKSDAVIRFWEPFVVATMNCELKNASAKILVNILKRAFIEDLSNSKLILPTADSHTLLKPVINCIEANGAKIIRKCKINKINCKDRRVVSVETSDGLLIEADFYLFAIQPFALRKILPENLKVEFEYLTKFHYSPIVSVYIWTEYEIFNNDFFATIDTDIQWIFNRNNIIKSNDLMNYSYSITISSAWKYEGMKPSEIIEIIKSNLTKLFPNFKTNSILHYRVITEKFATFEANSEIEKLRPSQKTKISNLYLAGDWTDTELPATIEGASYSGKKAAQMIMSTING